MQSMRAMRDALQVTKQQAEARRLALEMVKGGASLAQLKAFWHREVILALFMDTPNLSQIARKLGTHRNTVSRALKESVK